MQVHVKRLAAVIGGVGLALGLAAPALAAHQPDPGAHPEAWVADCSAFPAGTGTQASGWQVDGGDQGYVGAQTMSPGGHWAVAHADPAAMAVSFSIYASWYDAGPAGKYFFADDTVTASPAGPHYCAHNVVA